MRAASTNGAGLLRLRPPGPLDFDLTLQRYRLWGEDPANVYRDGAFHRVARVGGRRVPFQMTAGGGAGRPTISVGFVGADTPATRAALRAEAARLLGLDADLDGFYRATARDAVLAPLVGRLRGLRPTI